MASLRILIATHAPLNRSCGAGQSAMNLAECLQQLGHDVTLWSAHCEPEEATWWQAIPKMRAKIDAFVKGKGAFDFIEIPAYLVTSRVLQAGPVVIRSVQPELLYLQQNLSYPTEPIRSFRHIVRRVLVYLYSTYCAALTLLGWSKARHIFCLGCLELMWMNRHFPWWKSKMSSLVCLVSSSDHDLLKPVRQMRTRAPASEGYRFLWIGRWHPQKGTEELINFIRARATLCPADTFTIAGCGPRAEADCPSILLNSGQLRLIENFAREDLPAILAANDIGLFTSPVEGWGLALNEMLESGLTVFATCTGGVPELRRFFPRTLRTFPPPIDIELELDADENWTEYYQEFDVERISKEYLRQVSSKLFL